MIDHSTHTHPNESIARGVCRKRRLEKARLAALRADGLPSDWTAYTLILVSPDTYLIQLAWEDPQVIAPITVAVRVTGDDEDFLTATVTVITLDGEAIQLSPELIRIDSRRTRPERL
jgi:hypothetical protein